MTIARSSDARLAEDRASEDQASEVRWFDPQPTPDALPAHMPSPFVEGWAHPIARRAAELLIGELSRGEVPGVDALTEPGAGKMFGVLVVRAPDGRIGWLRAFSGMLDGRWRVEGFTPPAFDEAARDAFWPSAEAELDAIAARSSAIEEGALRALRTEREALEATQARERTAMAARHRENKHRRDERRRTLDATRALAVGASPAERASRAEDAEARRALEEESRADKRERRQLDAAHAGALEVIRARITAITAERDALETLRAARSTEYLDRIQAGYVFRNFSRNSDGAPEVRTLRDLFTPERPPGGAGDCAAPKLLAHAQRLGLAPIALAELWWGAPPKTGGRRAGEYYAACRAKCGPILAFVLRGLDVDPAPVFGAAGAPAPHLEPRVVFEDRWLVVVDKPSGILSVPGRGAHLADSVATRLRARDPAITGLVAVHRLDLDTSGLLVCAKDERTWSALQKQFAARAVEKRYVAWVDGEVRGDHGVIELALRVDVDDRPRQIHDPIHGKPARTEWRVIERRDGRTKVALTPRTGRTHQLRVHAAHALGLDAPITGDRLYGRAADRLMLHAEAIAFTHPHTGARIELESPAPF